MQCRGARTAPAAVRARFSCDCNPTLPLARVCADRPGPSLPTPGLREVLEFGKLAPTDPRIKGITLDDFKVAPPAP